ncbi:iron-containing alcohol dehydrogenase [Lichenicoccus roseus]|uniref:Alcohol dehydrogenase 2 n=1 Tax=Lichenicoccus roseus TaxID=2683649 RepID=A0A5R9J2F8_9PROT|nr:iron-containing alcohol dehydrogenase [Lichenicoccus roseus]TLU71043.1 iron-containing alcohol dehydrogenase [Lichenicoccus roseus]
MKSLYLPGSLRVGGGSIDGLPDALRQIGLRTPLIVTDPFMASSGVLDRVLSVLDAAGVSARVFDGVVPDPTVASVEAAVAVLRGGQHDCVIGLGGGSPIDTAKMVAVLALHDTSPRALRHPHVQDQPGLPVVAVPTTAGTGSEATRFTIITDEATQEKMLCVGLAYLPRLAIVDYELTLSKPWRLTADTGLDALTHAIEAYVSRQNNPFADALALAAMRGIWPNIATACTTPGDRRAREAMMLGALQAGMAFSNSSVALVHGMSRPIGAHFHVAHGLSNAMLLPAVTAWSIAAAEPRYADCARAMGVVDAGAPDRDAAMALVSALEDRNRELEVPSPRRYGLDPERWTALLPLMAEQALASGSPGNNPLVPDTASIVALYREIWDRD